MNEKIKILYVITQDEWGGAQRYVFDLASGLGDGFEVTVAVGSPEIPKGLIGHIELAKDVLPEKFKNVNYVQLKHLVREISWREDRLAVDELKQLFTRIQPDIVHLNSSKASIIGSYAVKKLSKKLRPKVVYTVHGWVFNEPLGIFKTTLYKILERISACYKDSVIVLSEQDKRTGERLGMGNKVTLIPHGLELTRLLAKPEARKYFTDRFGAQLDAHTQWFGTIANAYKTKGLDVLIEAIACEKEKLAATGFFIIGGGPELQTLRERVQILELHNVYFCDHISFADSYLLAFDAFVLPSRKEGLPYAILEALVAKVPVIATNVGGIPSLIENKKSGLLVKPDSVAELASALVYAFEHPEEMQAFAAQTTPPTTLEQMIATTSSLYSKLRAERRY